MAEAEIDTSALDRICVALDGVAKEKRPQFERKALRAVAALIQPALKAATPEETTVPGTTSLPRGALRAAVQSRIHIGTNGEASTLAVGFGKLGHVARFVDEGHANPTAHRAKAKRNTPAHPFVREVQETTANTAVDTYVSSMQQQIDEEIKRLG